MFDIFKILGEEKTLKLLNEIRIIGFDNDCNNGEILDDIGTKLKVCYECYKYREKLIFILDKNLTQELRNLNTQF